MIKRILNRHKSSNQNINFRMVLSVVLALMMLVPSMPVRAATTKTMTVEFEEQLDGVNRSKIITIPNLKSITKISVNTGNVNHSINNEKVTINVTNGSISRQVWNDEKESKSVSNYLTSATNSFADTNSYSDAQGFSGTLYKNGNSFVISGSSPHDWIKVDDIHYSEISGIFNGVSDDTLGSGWDYTIVLNSPSKYKGLLFNDFQYLPNGTKNGTYTSYSSNGSGIIIEKGQNYRLKGFANTRRTSSGTYPSPDKRDWEKGDFWGVPGITYWTVELKQNYDTRIYRQDYLGTAYKGNYDNYYKYAVTIEYIENSKPNIISTQPTENLYFSKLKLV